MSEDEKKNLTKLPIIIIENATSAFSKLRNWVWKQRTTESIENDDEIIENKYASIALKSILKNNDKAKTNATNEKPPSFLRAVKAITDFSKINTKRREQKRGLMRRGPIPIAELPISERGSAVLTHATLNPNFQTKKNEEGSEGELPSNRGLLTYFARIGISGNADEEIDLIFITSLLSAGADINVGDKYGQTILHAVARDWNTDIAKFVISNGGDINIPDEFGRTPVHVAAAVNYPEMIEFLVQNGANLHARTKGEMQTPIHYAAKFNAVKSMRCLVKLGAKISDRDYKQRTPLFLAAENGRRDVIEFMLDIEAPVASYDDVGTCAVALMVEKMPDLAYRAMDQFLIEDKPTRTDYYHLCALEYDTRCKIGQTPAKSVLETLVFEENKDLVQHKVITKLIEVKWEMTTKWQAVFDIAINLIHACLFTVLTVTYDKDGIKRAYSNLKEDGWKIALEILFVIITVYFIIKQIKTGYRSKERHVRWQRWRIHHMSKDYQYCHPQWPEEKRYLKSEIERVRKMQQSSNSAWAYYEWLTVFGIVCIIVLHVIYVIEPLKGVATADKFAHLIVLFLLWLRLLKPMKSVPAMSSLIVMLADIAKGSVQFLYVFMEFYIPLAIAFHIMFGGDINIQIMKDNGISDKSITNYETIQQMMFSVLWATLGGSFEADPLTAVDKIMAEFMVSILFAVLKLVAMNLFISLMSYLFGRVYNKARATALLQSANYILIAERNLNIKNSKRARKRLRAECNPLATYETGLLRKDEEENEIEMNVKNINMNIANILKATSTGEKENGDKTDDDKTHKIKIIMENVQQIKNLQTEAENEFNEKWTKIQENQTLINKLLKRPEVKEFILRKSAGKKVVRKRPSSLSR